jgi:purine-binding chemotaxis protein CheW
MKTNIDNPKKSEKLIAADLMPRQEEELQVLRERMKQISKHTTEQVQHEDDHRYVRFKLGDNEFYGIPYQHIKEVMSVATLTKLPCVPHFIAGIINRRGALLSVLDPKQFFNFISPNYVSLPYIIVLKNGGITIGMLADTIEGTAVYDAAALEAPLSFVSAIKPEYITGLHNGVTAILNIEMILTDLIAQMEQSKNGVLK